MLKWFRKYNKFIMVVGGALLMVVFLLGNTVQVFMPDPASRVVGTLGDEKITVGDQQRAGVEVDLLASLMPRQLRWRLSEEALPWLLMVEEARRQGLYSSDSLSRQLLTDWEVSAQQLIDVKQRYRVDEQFILQALAHWQMVDKLQQLVWSPTRPSEPRLRHFARDVNSTVQVEAVVVDAETVVDQVEEPAEAALRDQFNRYRAAAPGETEPYGFGYRLPARVMFEYMMVPRDRVAAEIERAEIEVDARRYYMDHPEQFMAEPDSAEGEEADDQPAESRVKPYREVREQIMERLHRQATQEKIDKIVAWVQAKLSERIRRLPQEDGFRKLPIGYQPPDYESLAAEVQQEFGILPDVVRLNDQWYALSDVNDIDPVGDAFVTVSDQQVPLADYLTLTRELGIYEEGSLMPLRLQVGVTGAPLRDVVGNRYFVRVIGADAAHVPQSLSEVRDRVERDVKLLHAFSKLRSDAGDYLQSAVSDGLDAVAEQFDAALIEPEPFSRQNYIPYRPIIRNGQFLGYLPDPQLVTPEIEGIGQSQTFVDAVYERLQAVRDAGGLDAAAPEATVGSVALPERLELVLFRIVDYSIMPEQEFDERRGELLSALLNVSMKQASQTGGDRLGVQALSQRVNYTPEQGDRVGDGEAADQEGG